MTYELGIDYASVDDNPSPTWSKAVAAGTRFVFVRGSRGAVQDPTSARDRDAIRAAGLVYGAYIGPDISSTAPAPDAQVETFAAASGLQPFVDFAPAIDIEFPHGIAGTGMTRAEISAWLGKLVAAVAAKFGCKPIVYSSARVLETTDTDTLAGAADAVLGGCPLWLAHYVFDDHVPHDAPATLAGLAAPPVPSGLGDPDDWWVHQYQGDARAFPGGLRQVDLDRFNPASSATAGTRRSWIAARLQLDDDASDAALDAAIRACQTKHGLEVDGIIGPATFAAMSWLA